jgi:hypothetical protein
VKKLSVLFGVMCMLFAVSASAGSTGVDGLGWLQGCWEGRDGEATVAEQWMKPDGRSMLAMSRTVKGGKTVGYEFVRVWEDEAGSVYFTAKPAGQAEASFKLVRSSASEAVFENPDHDFPQRIVYRLVAPDALEARIEGTNDGKPLTVTYPMRRVACAGP